MTRRLTQAEVDEFVLHFYAGVDDETLRESLAFGRTANMEYYEAWMLNDAIERELQRRAAETTIGAKDATKAESQTGAAN